MVEPKAEFGNYLTATRQRTGRSLEDIARSTGVARRHLEALEQGHGELLPAGMHRRTILRSYATAVGLDARTTIERFERIFGPSLPPLVITGSPAGKAGSTLWRRAITFPVRCARWVTGSVSRTARWIIGLPGRAVRWVFTAILRPIYAAIAWSARLARGVAQSFVNTVKWTAQIPVYAFERVVRMSVHAVQSVVYALTWTVGLLGRAVQTALALVSRVARAVALIPVHAFKWTVQLLVAAAQAAAALVSHVARAVALIPVHAFKWTVQLLAHVVKTAVAPALIPQRRPTRRDARNAARARKLALRVPGSAVMVPAAIILSAFVTSYLVTRQGWASDAPQPEPTAPVDRPVLRKATLIDAGVETIGPATVIDVRSAADSERPVPSVRQDDQERRQAVPSRSPAQPRVRRAVERKAPAVVAIRNPRSRDARTVGAARNTVTRPRLVVTSIPSGARVTVNGIAWGVTPLTIRHLPAGDKTVRVTKDGYVGGERRLVLGEEGGTASVGLTLRRRR